MQFDAGSGLLLQHPTYTALKRRHIHDYLDIDLSFQVPVMTVDEIVAEKLTRWHHRPLVRDLYDLSMLRQLITDTAAVVKMWVIKGHYAYHNPLKGATTSALYPADTEGIINVPTIRELDLDNLQLDQPANRHETRMLVNKQLAEFLSAYEFCIDEMDDELEEWATDKKGLHKAAVGTAAIAMSTEAMDPQRSAVDNTIADDVRSKLIHTGVQCGQRLDARHSCQRLLRHKPCPLHPNSPGSRKIKLSS